MSKISTGATEPHDVKEHVFSGNTAPDQKIIADTNRISRMPGVLRGKLLFSEDFDNLPPDILEVMENGQ